MSNGYSPNINRSRRRVIKGLGASGLGLYLGTIPGRASAESTGELGSFEGSIDGWRTNGGNELGLVPVADHPAFITGEYGLRVDIDGDPRPMIENTERVQQADFVDRPYLTADVVASPPSGPNVDISFTIRYHYAPNEVAPRNDSKPGHEPGEHGQKPAIVEESDTFTVTPHMPATLSWDMSEIPAGKRASPKRLEIVWQPADGSAGSGPRGRGGQSLYSGDVVFDDIRLSDVADEVYRARHAEKFTALEFEHGLYQETHVEVQDGEFESGQLRFEDGTGVPYEVEILSDSKIVVTLDGERFNFGEGWE